MPSVSAYYMCISMCVFLRNCTSNVVSILTYSLNYIIENDAIFVCVHLISNYLLWLFCSDVIENYSALMQTRNRVIHYSAFLIRHPQAFLLVVFIMFVCFLCGAFHNFHIQIKSAEEQHFVHVYCQKNIKKLACATFSFCMYSQKSGHVTLSDRETDTK